MLLKKISLKDDSPVTRSYTVRTEYRERNVRYPRKNRAIVEECVCMLCVSSSGVVGSHCSVEITVVVQPRKQVSVIRIVPSFAPIRFHHIRDISNSELMHGEPRDEVTSLSAEISFDVLMS